MFKLFDQNSLSVSNFSHASYHSQPTLLGFIAVTVFFRARSTSVLGPDFSSAPFYIYFSRNVRGQVLSPIENETYSKEHEKLEGNNLETGCRFRPSAMSSCKVAVRRVQT
jgi:hypothetical protein